MLSFFPFKSYLLYLYLGAHDTIFNAHYGLKKETKNKTKHKQQTKRNKNKQTNKLLNYFNKTVLKMNVRRRSVLFNDALNTFYLRLYDMLADSHVAVHYLLLLVVVCLLVSGVFLCYFIFCVFCCVQCVYFYSFYLTELVSK